MDFEGASEETVHDETSCKGKTANYLQHADARATQEIYRFGREDVLHVSEAARSFSSCMLQQSAISLFMLYKNQITNKTLHLILQYVYITYLDDVCPPQTCLKISDTVSKSSGSIQSLIMDSRDCWFSWPPKVVQCSLSMIISWVPFTA